MTATHPLAADTPNPPVVLSAASITSAVTAAAGIAVTLGVLPAVDSGPVLDTANLVISAVFAVAGLAHVLVARRTAAKVTPVTPESAPKAADGTPLVPVTAVARQAPTTTPAAATTSFVSGAASALALAAAIHPMPAAAAAATPIGDAAEAAAHTVTAGS